ncbi:MAG TPA: V-type ATPase 116kDa subunit family protein [Dehalococcoidia bacterium]|nr:V-type ATPase 116kDa subunit family protein [Dehalococcoidia bacterium]
MIPLIVNTPDPMAKVRVVTTKDYSTKTLKTLHTAGVLHVEESEELKPIDKEAIEGERRKIGELLTNINDILAYVPKGERVSLKEDVEVIYTRPFDEVDSEVRLLCTKLSNMQQRAAKLNEEVKKLTELTKYLGSLERQADIRLGDLNFSGSYLFSRVFVFPNELFETLYPKLRDYILENLTGTVENETVLYTIAKVEDQKTIESIVKDGGGKILSTPGEDLTLREFLEVADGNIHSLEEELTRLHTEIENKSRENLEKLVLFREALSAESERLAVLEKASESKYVTLIEGWIPESNVESTISQLKENIGYVFIDTRKPEQTEEPPTKMKNPAPLKPFEVIVNLFGTPKYGEWDPTPVIAYFFAFFFGLMLGDVVYAIIIMLFAYRGLHLLVNDPQSEGFKLFQRTLYISGGVALVVGLLTGSYLGDFYTFFGIETLALSEWIKAVLGNATSFILLSIAIGLIHVNLAHIMALIRGIRQKGVALGKAGLFLLQIAGIPLIMHVLFGVEIPLLPEQAYPILMYLVFLSIVLIVVSSIVQKGVFLGGIFWLFDITGLLGDVMSYCRLAGVGLATFYLATSFNLMARVVSDMVPAGPANLLNIIVGGLILIVILIIGHAINLVLSGITCFVHSLRLCFVEFLLKFYEGGGKKYSPLRLRTQPVFVKT